MKLRRMHGLLVALLSGALAAASELVPLLQGLVPTWAYVVLTVAAAVLPGVLRETD